MFEPEIWNWFCPTIAIENRTNISYTHIILSLKNEDYWDTWNCSLKKNCFRIGVCRLCRCRPTAVPAERSEAYQLQAACNLSIVQQDVQLSSESVSSPSAEAHTSAANANNSSAKYGGEAGILGRRVANFRETKLGTPRSRGWGMGRGYPPMEGVSPSPAN